MSSRRVALCAPLYVDQDTHIYLTDDQSVGSEVASAEGVSMAEAIRRGLAGYLDEQAELKEALDATFGVAKDLEVPSRDEWERG